MQVFGGLSPAEIKKMHENFVVACGGEIKNKSEKNFNLQVKSQSWVNLKKEKRWEQTLALIQNGKSISEVAFLRGRKVETIIEHLEELKKVGKLTEEIKNILRLKITKEQNDQVKKVHSSILLLGAELLKPIHDSFDEEISYETIRVARLLT